MIKKYKERGGFIKTGYQRIFVCIVLLVSFSTSFQLFAGTRTQETRVSLSMRNVQLEDILKEIKNQTNIDFVCSRDVNSIAENISLQVTNATIDDVMRKCLEGTGYTHQLKGEIIVILKRIEAAGSQNPEQLTVKGKVTDEKGEPIPGVNIIVVNNNSGTITNADGTYEVKVPEENAILMFSFIGFEKQTVDVNGRSEIDVQLKTEISQLSDVVITGMEIVKNEHVTGVATVLESRDLQDQGISGIDQILDGKVAGLNSTNLSGDVGTRSKITIRGENSLTGNTEPLWILDGLPMTSGVPKNNSGDYAGTIMQDGVGNIRPEDIASITILKDAAGAAIYGAKAANGVIVITTKKGFRSKTVVSYSGNVAYSANPKIDVDFMNSAQKLQYERSLVEDFGINYSHQAGRGGRLWKDYYNGNISKEQYDNEIARLSSYNTNWFDEIFEPAFSHTHNLSLRGGTEKISYYTSLSYSDKNGIVPQNKEKNSGIRMNLDYRPNDKFIVNLQFSGNARTYKNHASIIDPFKYAVFANTYERVYDDNGGYANDLTYLPNNYTEETTSGYRYQTFNIMNELSNTAQQQDGLDLSMTADLKYYILPGLSLQSMFRSDISQNIGITEVSPGTYSSYSSAVFAQSAFLGQDVIPMQYDDGMLSETSGKSNSWSMRNQIDYSQKVGTNHLFSVLLANEITSRKFNNFGYSSPIYDPEYRITGVPTFENDMLLYEDMHGAISRMFNTSDGQDRTVSFLGQIRYSYKDKYVLNLNARADGADVIGDGEKYTPLGSVSTRWNIDREKFFGGLKGVVNQLSIRGSYGFTGNIDRTAYPFSTITLSSNRYMNNYYVDEFSFPNPSVSWARKTSANAGLSFSIFDNLLSFDGNFYQNKTEDILTTLKVPVSTGRTDVIGNGGVVENTGVELAVSMRIVQTRDFSFYASANMARNKNVVTEAYNGLESYKDAIKTQDSKGGVLSIMGQETGGIYGWQTAGVHTNSGYPMYYLTDEGKQYYARILDRWDSFTAAEQKYYHESGMVPLLTGIPDAVALPRDPSALKQIFKDMQMASMQYLGRSNPKYIGGFSTTMRYKNLSFHTYWTYKAGHLIQSFNDRKNAPKNTLSTSGNTVGSSDFYVSGTNREQKYLYRWRNSGDVTNIPNFVERNDFYSSMYVSEDFQKGDYLRLSSLVLKYRVPNLAKKLGLTDASVTFTGNNLFTFTGYKGLDVTTGSSFAYPTTREYNLKLNIVF